MHLAVFDHALFQDMEFSELDAWLWLISKAAWKDTTHCVAGKVLPVPTGSLFVTLREMQREWNWKSDYRVRDFLAKLKNQRMINADSNAGKTLVTICNYELYQKARSEPTQDDDENQRKIQRKSNALKEEGLEYLVENNSSEREGEPEKGFDFSRFEEWFAAWPTCLSDDEDAARSEWVKLTDEQRADALDQTPKFIAGVRASKRTVFPQAGKFLSKRQWERVRKQPPPAPKPKTKFDEIRERQEKSLAAFARGFGTGPRTMGNAIDAFVVQNEAGKMMKSPDGKGLIPTTEARWKQRVDAWTKSGQWEQSEWGPPPGAPGCNVPAHLCGQTIDHEPAEYPSPLEQQLAERRRAKAEAIAAAIKHNNSWGN
ncbi:hypothetical protein [Neorhizobium sp. DAR64860/K0K1]|uniref:hypothetical protein n=1 Tax=Neorhizobium sp. DAR64860/K0K1 TaxID=3421955 RepID=UPI003D2A6AE6